MREYGIDLLKSDMSWRRFCVLYRGLSPGSLVCRNYDRVARREGVPAPGVEEGAWRALTGLARPGDPRGG